MRPTAKKGMRNWAQIGIRIVGYILFAIMLCHFPVAAATPTTSTDKSLSFIYHGEQRTYWLHIPSTYNGTKPLPLVMALHGMGGTGSGMAASSGLSEKADTAGFIAVYPDALGKPATWNWLPYIGNNGPDDIGFLRALIAHLKVTYKVDAKRIYVTGHSAGGMMTYRVGAVMPDIVAAIAPVAGSMGLVYSNGRTLTIPRPKKPVPVLIIHGLRDDVVPYDGGPSSSNPLWSFMSVAESRSIWTKVNGCSSIPFKESLQKGQVQKETYTAGKAGASVEVITLPSGDHNWPGANMTNASVRGADLIWEFFSRHTLPEQVSLWSRLWRFFFGRTK